MIIIADSNEQATSPETISNLQKVFPKVLISKLSSGDLNIILEDGSILAIERKEIHDFLASIGDGRLFAQVENMATHAKYSVIVITGTLGYTKDDMAIANGEITNWHGASVRGAMYAVMFSACPVFLVNKENYASLCLELSEFVTKEDQRLQRNHKRIVTFPPVEDEVDILCAFPDVGLKRANSLMDFIGGKNGNGTLAEAMSWVSALPLIPAESRPQYWGMKSIDKFRKTLGLKENQYLEIREETQE